jgi:hypothetical protein
LEKIYGFKNEENKPRFKGFKGKYFMEINYGLRLFAAKLVKMLVGYVPLLIGWDLCKGTKICSCNLCLNGNFEFLVKQDLAWYIYIYVV